MAKFAPKAIRYPKLKALRAPAKPKVTKYTDPAKAVVAEMNKRMPPSPVVKAALKEPAAKPYRPPAVSRTQP